jgi:hypothetical protein
MHKYVLDAETKISQNFSKKIELGIGYVLVNAQRALLIAGIKQSTELAEAADLVIKTLNELAETYETMQELIETVSKNSDSKEPEED